MSIEISKTLTKDGIELRVSLNGFFQTSKITITKEDICIMLGLHGTANLEGSIQQSPDEYVRDMLKEGLLHYGISTKLEDFGTYRRETVIMVAAKLAIDLNVKIDTKAISAMYIEENFGADMIVDYFAALVARKKTIPEVSDNTEDTKRKQRIKKFVESTLKRLQLNLKDMDSLDVVEFAMAIEEEYGIDLADGDEIEDAESVDELVEHIFAKLNAYKNSIEEDDEDDDD